MSIFKPEYLWMATGSKQGFKYEMLKPVKEYNVIAFPDKGEYYEWQSMTMELNGFGFRITVNDWMENQTAYDKGTDLADVYLDGVENTQARHKVEQPHKEAPKPKPGMIISNMENNVNRMAQRNPNLWLLINEFGLTGTDGHEIRKVS